MRRHGIDQDIALPASRADALDFLLIGVATAAMIEATRVLLTYTAFGIDQRRQILLTTVPVLAVLATMIGGVALRYVGARTTVLLSGTAMSLAWLTLEVSGDPGIRIPGAAAVVAGWTWLLLVAFTSRRGQAIFGVVLGFGLDLVIRIGTRTLGLPWMPTATDYAIALVVGVVLFVGSIYWFRRSGAEHVGSPRPWAIAAVGPGFVLYHLVFGSIGLIEVNADLDFPVATTMPATGMVLGMVSAVLFLAPWDREWVHFLRSRAGIAGISLVGGLALAMTWIAFWLPSAALIPAIGFAIATPATMLLLAHALSHSPVDEAEEQSGPLVYAVWLTTGMGLLALLLWTYFFAARPELAVALAYGTLVALAMARRSTTSVLRSSWRGMVFPASALSVGLVLASVTHLLTWTEPEAQRPLDDTFRVMTYNIRSGFGKDHRFNLEATASVIEEADPDVVVLQEATRGWPFTTGIDQATWLSQRLDMPFIFGHSPTNDLWGVTVLSNAPMSEIARYELETSGFSKGAVLVQVEGEDADLWIIGTHFAAPGKATAARVEEAEALIEIWNGRTPMLILGDFNATPDSRPLEVLTGAGLVDIGQETGVTAPTFFAVDERIDHIFATPDIDVVSVNLIESDASDHMPIIADVRLPD